MTAFPKLRIALDRCSEPLRVFFRDDDAGWDDAALRRLVEVFLDAQVALDLAVIPTAIGPPLGTWLRRVRGCGVGPHQHGLSHRNHEPRGRKCEFGASRDAHAQLADVMTGAERLAEALGCAPDPIFTPPWNRCSPATFGVLRTLGFRALSRDRGARPVLPEPSGLQEVAVDLDWARLVAAGPADAAGLDEALARLADRPGGIPLGIMLHHAVMTSAELCVLRELLRILAGHDRVRCVAMRDLLRPPPIAMDMGHERTRARA